MFKCKIGLISISHDYGNDCFLNLGEVCDKTIKKDIHKMFELHKHLKYMCHFKAKIKDSDPEPDNLEEICSIQDRYKLTRKIILHCTLPEIEEIVRFSRPELYDISCMVPLFSLNSSVSCDKTFPNGNESPTRVFIVFPYNDPITRGEMIDSCINICEKRNIYFYALGKLYGRNKLTTADLNKRYLLSIGVKPENVLTSQNDDFPDCIMDIINMVDLFLQNSIVEIWIVVARDDMNQILRHIRLLKQNSELKRKVYLLCN